MFCSQCGSPLPEGSKFCFKCGAPVAQVSPKQPSAPSFSEVMEEEGRHGGAPPAAVRQGFNVMPVATAVAVPVEESDECVQVEAKATAEVGVGVEPSFATFGGRQEEQKSEASQPPRDPSPPPRRREPSPPSRRPSPPRPRASLEGIWRYQYSSGRWKGEKYWGKEVIVRGTTGYIHGSSMYDSSEGAYHFSQVDPNCIRGTESHHIYALGFRTGFYGPKDIFGTIEGQVLTLDIDNSRGVYHR